MSEDEDDSCSSSEESESVSSSGDSRAPQPTDACPFAKQVRLWTNKVPIGLGFCPWAMKSQRQGLLKISTCDATCDEDVVKALLDEAKQLEGPLATTLLVCPHVQDWKSSFEAFDEFLKPLRKLAELQHVTLVAFHPHFLRWRALPEGVGVGTKVHAHKAIGGFQKSQEVFEAIILETTCRAFGRRKIRVEFQDGTRQYIPTDYCRFATPGDPLPDNAMHRAPYPTIHLIQNQDLASTSLRDVSRVKRKNAQRMVRLGWEGIESVWMS